MSNIVKCSHCGQIMIAELFNSHECDIPLKDTVEIPVSSFYDCSTRKKQNMVGVGLDGVRYWFKVKRREAMPVSTEYLQHPKPTEDLPECVIDNFKSDFKTIAFGTN